MACPFIHSLLWLAWFKIKIKRKERSWNDKKWNCSPQPAGVSAIEVLSCQSGRYREIWEQINRLLCGLSPIFLLPSCFLIHAKWNKNLCSNMQILMQSRFTYGARTAAFAFDLCSWQSSTIKKKKNLKSVKGLNWSEHKRRYMVLIGLC